MSEIGARHKMTVSGLAKFKTIVQITGLSMMLFREDLFGLPVYDLGLVLTILAAVLTLWSMIAYLVAAGPELRGRRGT
jgi:phosphatidylglycerophosphate synthase